VQVFPGQGQDEGVGAGGDHQSVIGRLQALTGRILRSDHALDAVDCRDLPPSVQRDAVVLVPGPVVEHDLIECLLTRQYG